jgi:hypothetical protein
VISDASVPDLVEAYEETARRWGQLQSDSAQANRVFEENHAIYKRLRDEREGQSAISRLRGDESEAVRLLAATHSLAWEPDAAVETLRAIKEGGGLVSVTAKYTLRSYESGKLDLNW